MADEGHSAEGRRVIVERPADRPREREEAPSARDYVPPRCLRAPNSTFDRAFAIHVCNQRDGRCRFHGPAYVLSEQGRVYECRAREGDA